MEKTFIATPSGQLISARHIVTLDILGSGVEEETRHGVQATLVTGEKQTLKVFQGSDSQQQAQGYLSELLNYLGAEQIGGDGRSGASG